MQIKPYLLAVIFLAFSCEKVTFRELDPVVQENLVTFSSNEVPSGILKIATENRILILGETHYMQEHQEWGTVLLGNLTGYGYRMFFNELSQAYSWLIEDFVTGEREDLPGYIRYFDNAWLSGIRSINESLSEDEKLCFYYMDVNHSSADLRNSFIEIQKLIDLPDIFNGILSGNADQGSYSNQIYALQKNIKDNESSYRSKWGDLWYDRIADMISIEIPSIEFRQNNDNDLRESIMYGNIKKIIKDTSKGKVVINTGMYHAQKIALMGDQIPRIAQYLEQENPGKVYSMAFIGLKGQTMYNFYDTEIQQVDLVDQSRKRDLIHIIGVSAGSNLSFLPLSDPVFFEEMNVSYTKSDNLKVAPARQFDALITYPEIHILTSFDQFSYR